MFHNSTIVLLEITAAISIGLIAYFKWNLTHWQRLGIPTLNPTIPFGDSKKLFYGHYSLGEQFQQFYRYFRSKGHRHGGAYLGVKPYYIPIDLDIIKHILLTDFDHFTTRGLYMDEKNDPLSANLFCLKDQKWKDMRTQFTPTLTSGKMKMMFDILVEVSEEFKSTIDEYATSGEVFEAKDVSGRFSTDVIGSIAFGIKCSCLKNRESPFWKYAQRVFNDTPLERIIVLTHHALPHKLLRLIKYKVTKPDVEKFFMDTVRNIVAHREKNKIYRNDFMQSLLKLKNAEKVTEQITDESEKLSQQPLTLAQIATQVFSFLVGGLETTSSTMTCALYELALNPKIQNELRNEINSVVFQHDNELTYAGVMEMKFMDKVLCGTGFWNYVNANSQHLLQKL
jgi:cytochrome P450 family 6